MSEPEDHKDDWDREYSDYQLCDSCGIKTDEPVDCKDEYLCLDCYNKIAEEGMER